MGAESSVLENCTWGEAIQSPSQTDWSLRRARLKDETAVTVFQHKRKGKKEVDLLQRATKNLRTLRHPSLLRFISAGEDSDGSYLVTEEVSPLEHSLSSVHALDICAGLQSILEALNFLHKTVGISHNNVCLSSIYITSDGSWKLGGLEHSCTFQEDTAEFLDKCLAFRDTSSISPEEKHGSISTDTKQGHARDVYALGVLADSLREHMEDLGDLMKTFDLRVQDECLNSDPGQRPRVDSLLADKLFRNDFLEVLGFLKNVTTKTEEEKKDFFGSLTIRLLQLPEEVVARRLAVPLVSRFVMLDETAYKQMLPNLLTPYRGKRSTHVSDGKITPILSAQNFQTYLIPELFRIFHIRDLHIRKTILTYFSSYVDLFDVDILEDTIFPQLLLGLRDIDDGIVTASLRALSYLVPILGGDVVIGGSRKKFFIKGMPKFQESNISEDKHKPPSNLSGVIGKKILLKDLALLSNGGILSDEREAKRKEHDRKKEEARLRRDKRRKQLKEKKKNEINVVEIQSPDVEVLKENKQEACHVEIVAETEMKINPVLNERGSGDWLDWDTNASNMKGDNSADIDVLEDIDISDEIENELEQMSSDVLTSAIDEISSTVDWSDDMETGCSNSPRSTEQLKGKGALKLGGPNKSKQNVTTDVGFGDVTIERNIGQSTVHSKPTDKVMHKQTDKVVGKQTDKLMNKPTVMKSLNQSSLGSEFDIKGVKIESSSTSEMDFFSDMAPAIKSKDLLEVFAEQSQSGEKEGSVSRNVAFKVEADTPDAADVGGWGEDLDWGADDF